MQITLSPKILLALLPFIIGSLAQDGDKDGPAAPLDPKVSSYLAHLTVDPKYSSVAAVVSTAVSGTRAQSRILNGDLSKVTTRTWYSALPSDVRSFASSVDSERRKLEKGSNTATVSGAATTSAPGSAAPTATPSAPKSSAPPSSTAAPAPATPAKNAADTGIKKAMGMGLGVAGVLGVMVL